MSADRRCTNSCDNQERGRNEVGLNASPLKLSYKTYATEDAVISRGSVISELLQGAIDHPSVASDAYPTLIDSPYPAVFILNGVATIGKNEFFDAMNSVPDTTVVHLSTIDPVRDAVKTLLVATDTAGPYVDGHILADEIIGQKGDKYRDFLFNVKQAWEGHDYGATLYSIGLILSTIDKGPSSCKGIFIDSRETDTINRIVDTLRAAGIITLKILIIGDRTTPADWSNGCDSNICTDESFYDIVVHNNGSVADLEASARSFASTLSVALKTYGISRIGPSGDATITKRS
ncbi:MAG: hypothetical protein NC311_06640 [Muribaculaceae bacterium]|nr:hypothetical protein [Muribaculaceae bacterium]